MRESKDSKSGKTKYPSKAAEFEARIERLKLEGKMPTFYELLGAMGKDKIKPPVGGEEG